MRISKVIKKLQEIKEAHGDLSVRVKTTYYDIFSENMVVKIMLVFDIE